MTECKQRQNKAWSLGRIELVVADSEDITTFSFPRWITACLNTYINHSVFVSSGIG
jgi:hypothetical protein